MRIRTGIDIASISEMKIQIESGDDDFLATFLHPAEFDRAFNDIGRATSRWAAKEAVMKALGTGFGKMNFTEIEILSSDDGDPSIELHGEASTLAHSQGLSQWDLSLSRQGDWAVAVVVAVSER